MELKPSHSFENLLVQRVSEDSLQCSFVIWVKDSVPCHMHLEHTESVLVLQGKALMVVGSSEFWIKKGDLVTIPKNTPHGVKQVKGMRILKVLSTQAPFFDGTDRIFIEETK